MNKYNRDYLIDICERSVVPYYKWSDRDSYCAQINVQNIYRGLMLGLDYTVDEGDYNRLIINFINCNPIQPDADKYNLDIDSLDSYFELRGTDSEMFYCSLDFDAHGGYLPTEKRLQEADGNDWY